MNQRRKQFTGSDAFLRSQAGILPMSLPLAWKLLTLADFSETTTHSDASSMAIEALQTPHGAPPLDQQLKPHHTVCILIEDLTRTSPKKEILKVVLNILRNIGIPSGNIVVVIALGTHRPLSHEELAGAFGPEIVAEYSFVNHDCHAADLIQIGQLADGTAVKINRLAYSADFRIGIGSIFPHPLNGFGGGGKILFPGVADYDSIFKHHLRHSFRGNSALGILGGNDFHDEINAMATAGRLNFIVNSVLNHKDLLHQVVAGDPIVAHKAGTEICRAITSRQFEQKADVTIISSFPYTEGPQIMKPLAPAEMITRPGGTIILYADCRSPLPEHYFSACQKFRSEHGGDLRQAVLTYFADGRPIMADAPPELNMSMAQAMLAQSDFNVILVTGDISADQIARIGFQHAATLQDALLLVAEDHAEATVNIVPAGGVILPAFHSS
ncbi:lactate racemase domain-containing protein [Desulfopila aestuarii]|uniref:Nickel-dependent lactate racemase n=1 Tax=Desulfopila aestuarii DSM 18488 TaxID=1121416 RepID=A0A1M7XZ10_9BACT|nr:nickel-dependent lactate racemase [Desulfopila aestuarii]SHO44116.1 Nickel-dependent lactate racemase [Desulfopila aestuarii DSM 18488]